MTGKRPWHILVWLGLLTYGIISLGDGMLARAADEAPSLPTGLATPGQRTPIPEFSVSGIDGSTLRSADLLGKVVVVRFWATWWPICTGEMPSVQRVHDEWHAKGIVMLAISVDGGGRKAVQTFLEKNGYTMPTAVDTGMQVARQFGVRGVPMTYVISRQGIVIASGFGPVDFDRAEFKAYLQTLADQPGG